MTDPIVPAPAPEPTPQPAYQPSAAAPATYPGKTLGIVGLIVSFFFAIVGLILSAVALSQSKKAGYKNTPAKVGLILGIVFSVLWIIFWIFWGAIFIAVLQNCPEVSPGVYSCS
jgi:hypothetical protein